MKTYMEKEIDIMEGTISLLRSGIQPYELKVSDIAEAAEIGKARCTNTLPPRKK